MKGLGWCCYWRLLLLPPGWRGTTILCSCGTRLRLRDGEWTAVA